MGNTPVAQQGNMSNSNSGINSTTNSQNSDLFAKLVKDGETPTSVEKQAKNLFQKYDKDADGILTKEATAQFFRDVYSFLQSHHKSIELPPLDDALKSWSQHFTGAHPDKLVWSEFQEAVGKLSAPQEIAKISKTPRTKRKIKSVPKDYSDDEDSRDDSNDDDESSSRSDGNNKDESKAQQQQIKPKPKPKLSDAALSSSNSGSGTTSLTNSTVIIPPKGVSKKYSVSIGLKTINSGSTTTSTTTATTGSNTSSTGDLIIITCLNYGIIDSNIWNSCNPAQLWYYFPLILNIDQSLPASFYSSMKPFLTHKTDLSVKILVYWLNCCGMLPPNAKTAFGESTEEEQDTKKFFENMVTNKPTNAGQVYDNLKMCDPIFGTPSTVTKLTIVRFFKAHTRPTLCEISFKDSSFPPRKFIFKHGDDLRSDMSVQIMFYIFNQIWEASHMENGPFIHQYRILPSAPRSGFVEFVSSCAVQNFDWSKVATYTEEQRDTFIRSAAGAFLGSYVLGVRDRHKDNMLISDDCKFFHIDFGYMFNRKTWFDANRFAVPKEIRTKFPERWETFLDLIAEGYRLLRRSRGLISHFVTKLFVQPNAFTEQEIVACLSHCFYETWSEMAAVERVRYLAVRGEVSMKKKIKDKWHNIETES